MMKGLGVAGASFAVLLGTAAARAETYEVGADKPYATIQATLDRLGPGDVVEVQGDATYPGDIWFENAGTAAQPITVRGISVNGRRPTIEGIGTAQWHDMVVLFYANHLVFENFEIVGDGNPDHGGLVNKADDVILRDLVVHGVGGHGLLCTDEESGSLTLERCEFYGNGEGTYHHQIYGASDETMYPGSVFRVRHCYVHDGGGGNNVKSRAERNEIYYNWIEGAVYHELDLIGPDGQDEDLAREDSDVVGNVLVKTSEWRIARIGGDGTGNTAGRYRFVNNTMILGRSSDVAIGLQETVESVELHNNVVYRLGATGGRLWNHSEPSGPDPEIFGSNNWIQSGITNVPAMVTGTIVGADPGFASMDDFDLRPADDSPLIDAGNPAPTATGPEFPSALLLPADVPPARSLGTEAGRPDDGAPDIGAFEYGSGSDPVSSTGGTTSTGGTRATGGRRSRSNGGAGADEEAADSSDEGGCGCRVIEPVGSTRWAGLTSILVALGFLHRRRRRARSSSVTAPRTGTLRLRNPGTSCFLPRRSGLRHTRR